MQQKDLQMKFQKISAAIQQNKYLSAVSSALISLMAVTMVGAMFTLVNSLPIAPYQSFLTNTGLKAYTSLPLEVTTNLLSIYTAFAVAYRLAQSFDMDGFLAGMIGLISFFIVTPIGTLEGGGNALPFRWLGSGGLFVAMIVGILSARIYVAILQKGLYIKMPKGVPPTIEKSFAALTPGIIITASMLLIRGIFVLTPFNDIHTFVFGFIQTPLSKIGGSAPAFIFMLFLAHVFWFFGIHGTMLLLAVMQAPLMPLGIENLTAYQAGMTPPNALILQSLVAYALIGGSGATLGLVISMLRAKSKRYKTLGRIAIIPGLCAINEPVIFGMPLVLNTRFVVPFIFTPTLFMLIGYILTLIGVLPTLNGISAPTGTPVIATGFLMGGWRVALFQAVAIVGSYFMYRPAFKKADEEAYALEQAS